VIFKNLDGGMNWIDVARDRNRWLALVNAAIDRRVPKKKMQGISGLVKDLSASQEAFCSTEFVR
jgi:antibiotic biosynthesis monooxygenase (ABM) superfamily enzyme